MENDPRRAILESLKRNSSTATDQSELYQSVDQPDASTDTLKVRLGMGAPIGTSMNPMGQAPQQLPDIFAEGDDELEFPDIDLDFEEDAVAPEPPKPMPSKPRGNSPYVSQPFVAPVDDEPQTPIYRSSRQEEIESDAEDLEESGENHGKQMAVKLIVACIVVLIVFALVFIGIRGKPDSKPKTSGKPASSQQQVPASTEPSGKPGDAIPDGVILLKNDEISFDEDLYKDSMEISKIMELRNGNVFCYFKGIPEHFNQMVYIPVTADQYNYYSSGETVDINYNIATFKGTPYVLNATLKEF